MLPKYIIIFFHPYNTSIKDTKSFLKKQLNNKNNKNIKWIFLKAPRIPMTFENNSLHRSWFDYTTNYNGEQEDKIKINTLIYQRLRIIHFIKNISKKYNCDYNNILLGGISQGGCIALDVSCYIKVRCVFTLVSHRLYTSKKRKLKHPWYSLIANNDTVFLKNWIINDIFFTKKIVEVDDDHDLSNTDTDKFINDIFIEEKL